MTMTTESKMKTPDVLAALKGFSLEELDRVVAVAEQERQVKRDSARKALLDEVRTKAQALGLSLESLLEGAQQDGSRPKGTRAPVRPKYRHPETGETWSGRGSAPGWLKRLEEEGRRREEFAAGTES
jgi:DNA-binding protein H-NS